MLPSDNVYARLAPSRISGIGLIAIKSIPEDTVLFDYPSEFQEIRVSDIDLLPGSTKKLYDDFCIFEGTNALCPVSFDRMDVSWYINHSTNPNCIYDEEKDEVRTIKYIEIGSELTLDYFKTFKDPRNYTDLTKGGTNSAKEIFNEEVK